MESANLSADSEEARAELVFFRITLDLLETTYVLIELFEKGNKYYELFNTLSHEYEKQNLEQAPYSGKTRS